MPRCSPAHLWNLPLAVSFDGWGGICIFRAVLRRFSSLALLTAFILSCGGHWYVLQGIAWVGMVRDYSEKVPVLTAVKMTVSGQYPCKMCKAITEKRQQENDKLIKLPEFKKDFLHSPALVLAEPSSAPWIYVVTEVDPVPLRDTPPTPPPRQA